MNFNELTTVICSPSPLDSNHGKETGRNGNIHKEHTILLSRKRVNKGMKRMNSYLSLLLSFQPFRENPYLQVLRNIISFESLNFVAFTKPNKHKKKSKVFLQLGRICFRILLRQSENFSDFCKVVFSNRFSQHDRTITPVPNASSIARSNSPPSHTKVF